MDLSQYAGSESKYLAAKDLDGKRPKVVIEAVELVEFDDDTKGKYSKPAVKLRGKEKKLILNATNVQELGMAYGFDSEGWIGQEIGLSTKFYPAFGKDGIVVTALGKPKFEDDDIGF